MRDHHHIEGLLERIYSIGSRWSRRRWDDVWLAANLDDVRRVSATRPFGVKTVNSPALEGGDCIFDKTTLVQRIGVDENLHIHIIRDGQAAIDCRRGSTPVLMKLEGACPSLDLFNQTGCRARVALTEKAEIHGQAVGGLEHSLNVPWTRRAGRRPRAFGRPSSAAQHCC